MEKEKHLTPPIASMAILAVLACCGACDTTQLGEQSGRAVVPRAIEIPKTKSESLNACLDNFSLAAPAVCANLAVIPITANTPCQNEGGYLTLPEALKDKLVTISEVKGGGSVPKLLMTSNTDKRIFIPFGSIVTGGKQDRMLRDDIVLNSNESRKISVYCIERGRWSGRGKGGASFHLNRYNGSNRLKGLSNAGSPQALIWAGVSAQNTSMRNPDEASNFQGNFSTEEFKAKRAELEPISEAIARNKDACGLVVVLDGKVTGMELFASPGYFKKLWPQLFNAYVVDAASSPEKRIVPASEALRSAGKYLSDLESAEVAEKKKGGELRVSVTGEDALGSAVMGAESRRLIYLRYFPRPTQDANFTPQARSRNNYLNTNSMQFQYILGGQILINIPGSNGRSIDTDNPNRNVIQNLDSRDSNGNQENPIQN